MTTEALSERLETDLGPSLELELEQEPLPWHTRLVVGAAGWVASLCFMGFVGLLDLFEPAHLVVLAPLMAVVALVLRRAPLPLPDFWHQIAHVLALTARLLMAVGLADVTGSQGATALGMVAFEAMIGLMFPDAVQRIFSTFSAATWTLALADDPDDVWLDVVSVASVAVACGLWLGRGRLERLGIAVDRRLGFTLATLLATPAAYGMTAFCLALQLRFLWDRPMPAVVGSALGFGVLALGVVAVLLREHQVRPTLAVPALVATALVGVLTWEVPGVVLALAFTLVAFRAREALLVGVTGAFLVFYTGVTYYRLDTTLVMKGWALLGTGAVLLGARLVLRRALGEDEDETTWRWTAPRRWAALGLLLPLLVVGSGAARQERVIATGDLVYLELAPADPRSLVQGDYMRLRYRVGRDARRHVQDAPRDGLLVLREDEHHVRRFVRLHHGEDLGPDESLLRYRRRARDVEVASRAWLFQEGLAEEYQRARYGVFRVTDAGDAVLIGLADADQELLGPPRRAF